MDLKENRRWIKEAEKELKCEIENVFIEYIEWLQYDYDNSFDTEEKRNLLSLIHFFEKVGVNDKNGNNKLVGLFGYNGDEKENKLRRKRERKIIMKLGMLTDGESKKRAVLIAEEASVRGLGNRALIDPYPYLDKYTDYIRALNAQGYDVEYPAAYSEYIKSKWKEKSKRRQDRKKRKKVLDF